MNCRWKGVARHCVAWRSMNCHLNCMNWNCVAWRRVASHSRALFKARKQHRSSPQAAPEQHPSCR
eukprot:2338160-Lingulodinium_polyedra.AAC.1